MCGLFTTAILVCTYNSFLCLLKTNEDPCKTKEWLAHMQTAQITHRRKGLWQSFPCYHTDATWNKRKATFTCCQVMGYTNIIKPKCNLSWCSWEQRDVILKGHFHGSCIPWRAGCSSPMSRTAVILLTWKVCRCVTAFLPKTFWKVTSERNDYISFHSPQRARRRNQQTSLP